LTIVLQKFHLWYHFESGDTAVRTTSYSLPENLYNHIDLIQPTTLFTRFRSLTTNLRRSDTQDTYKKAISQEFSTMISDASGVTQVYASCNQTITIICLKQLYNATGYKTSAKNGNQIGITGYLEQFANMQDLQLFFQDQLPDAINSSFRFVSVNGEENRFLLRLMV